MQLHPLIFVPTVFAQYAATLVNPVETTIASLPRTNRRGRTGWVVQRPAWWTDPEQRHESDPSNNGPRPSRGRLDGYPARWCPGPKGLWQAKCREGSMGAV